MFIFKPKVFRDGGADRQQSTAHGHQEYFQFRIYRGVFHCLFRLLADCLLSPFSLRVHQSTKVKESKRQRKTLLEAAPALLQYIAAAGIKDELEGPE